ncbi:ABC transporter substrate-binding protein [Bacillus sp. FJAT-45350]|uniref:ABC transporter substrate-binding protein n=1 Tax=Bacillus sp. FJAT-45350 TaxID=2011014 RepID=UPI000BB6BCA4|nr:ABC transporter substrate-binding protein [Bacillus sp. FJAT-45350]
MKILKRGKWLVASVVISMMVACSGMETSTEQEVQVKDLEIEMETDIVEIENNEQILTFSEVPQRAVTLNQHVTEVMLALGLEDFMIGTAYLDDEILPEYQAAYEAIDVLADQYPSQEVFLAAEPDFAYAGWASAFREGNVGTVEQLKEFGVQAYLHQSSSNVGPTIEDVFTDIRNISKIFRVEERGESLIREMKDELEIVKEGIPSNEEPKQVFVYDSGDTTPFTVAKNFLNTLITMAGAENIFSDVEKNWAEVSWEEVVERNPDVIVIVDYGETSADDKRNLLLNHPALTEVTAIQEEEFIVMPLSAAAEGVRAPYALEILVEALYK